MASNASSLYSDCFVTPKEKPKKEKAERKCEMNRSWKKSVILLLLLVYLESAQAVEIEPKGKAIAAVLGGGKDVRQKTISVDGKDVKVFYNKDKLAFLQEGLYPPNCTHTWVVGVDRAKNSVTEVRVVEMECPHAFPTKEVSFLSQFHGKSVKDANSLDKDIKNIAKATGSCKLAIDAVKSSLKGVDKLKGQI